MIDNLIELARWIVLDGEAVRLAVSEGGFSAFATALALLAPVFLLFGFEVLARVNHDPSWGKPLDVTGLVWTRGFLLVFIVALLVAGGLESGTLSFKGLIGIAWAIPAGGCIAFLR